ncbi:MAG: 1-(5-phosphoribosyl)-5-[(5-phosphoribosylamino)methylideneamino]imidazole-4-carboxamide isomerase [Planctomycetes bacterium]|nr:1-(5-phosphoribosyl)-5-[(5-phosphoribosylamino)methylideneamino]imidazole-4-carboxamide isomerase [Planctomycetota bacterium]
MTFEIYPAIDILAGKCVRLRKGAKEDVTVYEDSPLATALRFEAAGAKFLHVVDLDGAFEGKAVNHGIIKEIASKTSLFVEVGGGVRNEETLLSLFDRGVRRAILGSMAAKDRSEAKRLICEYPGKVALGLDARNFIVQAEGWEEPSGLTVFELLSFYESSPVSAIIFTDIDRDGMLEGPNCEALLKVKAATRHKVIASGGVSGVGDVTRIRDAGLSGVIVGKALYDGKISIEELAAF